MTKRYPETHLYGLDISDEMLKTARKSLKKAAINDQVRLARASADSYSPEKDFQLDNRLFDKLIFSYSLSLIPVWKSCIDHAFTTLKSGGEMHIVDFSSINAHPFLIRKLMASSLKMFNVYFTTGIEQHLEILEKNGKGKLRLITLNSNRARYAVFTKS